jgi:hypothetical protein
MTRKNIMLSSAVFSGKHRAKSIPPVPHRFVADVDAALMQQILDIAERKGKASVHHNRLANDLRTAVKILEGVRFDHAETLRDHPARLNRYPSDKTTVRGANTPGYLGNAGLIYLRKHTYSKHAFSVHAPFLPEKEFHYGKDQCC